MEHSDALSFFMSDAYTQGVFIHEVFAYMFFLPYIWYLYVLFTYKTYLQMNQKIYFIMPITLFLLAVALSTGIFILAMRNFIVDRRITSMILICGIFLCGEVYRMIIVKKAKTSRENMQRYVKKCKIMYSLFFLLYLGLIITL